MELKFKAAYDGSQHLPLNPDADVSGFHVVHDWVVRMKPSTVLTIAAASALVSSLAPREPNGARSALAEEALAGVGYVKEHVVEASCDGDAVKAITIETVLGWGLPFINYLYGAARGEEFKGFLKPAPVPPSGKAGAKATTTN